MRRLLLIWNALGAFVGLFLITMTTPSDLSAQISPSAPTKEYIRLADRIIAIEHNPAGQGTMPSQWTEEGINNTCNLRSVSYSNGEYTVSSQGSILGASDTFEFLYVPVTGDVTIVAQMPSRLTGYVANLANQAAGLMLRTDLSASSAFGLIGVGSSGVTRTLFRSRATAGASATSTYSNYVQNGADNFYGPYWFKLVRIGSVIKGYISGDGTDWVQVGSDLTGMTSPTMYAGIAVASGSVACQQGYIMNATFRDVTVNTAADFFVTAHPESISGSAAGDTSTFVVSVDPMNGFADSVSFLVAGLPAGVSWSVTPTTVTPPGQTILTVTAPPGTAPGDYPFTIHATAVSLSHTTSGTFTVGASAGSGLASGWTATSVNDTCNLNGAASSNGVFTLTIAGGSLLGYTDSFEFVYVPVVGDVTLIGRMPISPEITSNSIASGIMLRSDLTADAPYALVGVGYYIGYKLIFSRRTARGLAATTTPGTPILSGGDYLGPYWFKLVRTGSTVKAYTSNDGIDWMQLGPDVTGFTETTMYVGLAHAEFTGNSPSYCTTSHVSRATFDQVTLAGGSGGGGPNFSIGISSGVPTVAAGSSLSMTTTVAAVGGFNGEVGLSVDDLPDGGTGTFSPPTLIGQGTSEMIIGTSASQSIPGVYTALVTGTSGSLEDSATATFTVDAPAIPAPGGSVSPDSGSGDSETFVITASDPSGAGNIQWIQFLVNDSLNGLGACYLHYDVASNVLYLRDNADPSWVASGELGQVGTLANSQCVVDTAQSSFAVAGTADVTLTLGISFATAFAGGKQTYALVDSGNLNSGWMNVGSWTIPVAVDALPSGWISTVINNSCSGNAATYASGIYTLTGAGGRFYFDRDSFEFAYIPITGDVTLIARIPSSLTGTALTSNGSAGIILRTGLSAASPYALVGVGLSGTQKLVLRKRSTESGSATATFGNSFSAPYWFKLVRSGTSISGWTAPDSGGSPGTWTKLGTDLTGISGTAYAGFAVANGANTTCTSATTATFDHVSITNP